MHYHAACSIDDDNYESLAVEKGTNSPIGVEQNVCYVSSCLNNDSDKNE